MLKKTTGNLNAQKLRILLIVSILLLIVIMSAVFILARSVLVGYAADVQQISDAAASSSKNLSALNNLKAKLEKDHSAVERAKNLVAESQSYAYQDQIIRDINTYASKSGIAIAGYQFNSEIGASSSGAAGSTPAPTPVAPGTNPTPTVSGLKTVSVSINLKTPINYTNIMHFIHLIEQNLTKMQLSGVSLSKDTQPNGVTVSALTIEVYVR